VHRVYLLTESASDFFAEKFGFRPVDRSHVDPGVASSVHFRTSARAAVAMRLDL
jgi:N-acetylglutamate synthase-like GNAT family acetyltransferase